MQIVSICRRSRKMNRQKGIIPFVLLFLFACTPDANRETPTQGNILVAADPSVIRITQEFSDGFNFLYHNAKVEVVEMNEAEAINALIDAKVRMIVIPGNIPAEQQQALKSQNYTAKVQALALDAAAVLVHPNNPDTALSLGILKKVLSGEITDWKQINPENPSGSIQVLLDDGGSSLSSYLRDSILQNSALPPRAFGAGSNPNLVAKVAESPGALGFIGINWIASTKDSLSRALLSSIRIVRLQNENDKQFYLPFQAAVGTGKYPLIRKINAITFEAKTGLVAGFIAFCAGEKGQRMVLKTGLMPAYKPSRNIELR